MNIFDTVAIDVTLSIITCLLVKQYVVMSEKFIRDFLGICVSDASETNTVGIGMGEWILSLHSMSKTQINYIGTFLCVNRILDDMEMYEQQDPFKLQDFINMSQFLNMFVYKSIMGQLFGEYRSTIGFSFSTFRVQLPVVCVKLLDVLFANL